MSKIKEIRETIDRKLDGLEKRASSLEAHLNMSKDNAVQELEARKRKLDDVLNAFKIKIADTREVAEEKKAKIQSRVEQLHVQLTLGKAETKDALEEQKKKISDAVKTLENNIDEGIEDTAVGFETLKQDFVEFSDALDAEMESLDMQFEMEKAAKKAEFEEQKKKLAAKIEAFRNDLSVKKGIAEEKAATFESQFIKGFDQIKHAFKDLIS
jgi:ABC-type transporter Mla subunit MlaD